jgi:hypothetical protein
MPLENQSNSVRQIEQELLWGEQWCESKKWSASDYADMPYTTAGREPCNYMSYYLAGFLEERLKRDLSAEQPGLMTPASQERRV